MSGSLPTKTVFRVTEEIRGAHPNPHHADYPLLAGDLLAEWDDGTYYKFAPGLGIVGFKLTAEQRATLELVEEVPPIKMVGLAEYAASCGVEVRSQGQMADDREADMQAARDGYNPNR